MHKETVEAFLTCHVVRTQASAPIITFTEVDFSEKKWPLHNALLTAKLREGATEREKVNFQDVQAFLGELSTQVCNTCYGYGHNQKKCATRDKVV